MDKGIKTKKRRKTPNQKMHQNRNRKPKKNLRRKKSQAKRIKNNRNLKKPQKLYRKTLILTYDK